MKLLMNKKMNALMVIGTQTSVVYEESLTFPSISPVGLHVQEHSHDSSKGESHCVNVRVLTRFSCHFHHLLLVVCLKRFKKVRVMDNPGLVLPSCMPNVCVWNPLVMSSTFGVLVCPWTGQTQREISFQSLRNKYIISCYTRVQYLCLILKLYFVYNQFMKAWQGWILLWFFFK